MAEAVTGVGTRFFRLVKPETARETRYIPVVLLLVLVSAAAAYALPWCQRRFIDTVTVGGYRVALWFLTGCGALLLAGGGADTLASYFARGIGTRIGLGLKRRILGALLGLPVGSVNAIGGGYLSGRLLNDLILSRFLYSEALLGGLRNLFKLVGGWVLIAVFDWRAALLLLAVLPFYGAAARFFSRRQFGMALDYCEKSAENNRSLYELLRNIALVKSRSAEAQSDLKFGRELDGVADIQLRRFRLDAWFQLVLLVLPGVCYFAAFMVGIKMISAGIWTLGGLWALNCYMHYLFQPLRSLSQSAVSFSQALAAGGRLADLAAMLPESGRGGRKVERLSGRLEARGLEFAYPGGPELFEKLNFTISPGEKVAVTGDSGCGKSTLAALILALLEPSGGELLADGVKICDCDLVSYRRRIGYLNQVSEFFSGTVRSNLTCGLDREVGDSELVAAISAVGLADRLPGGPAEPVAEGGANFSVGEKLRLALARELLRDVDILICDEPTANLDAANEALLLNLIDRNFSDRTVVMISHRETTAAHFTRRIDLGRGGRS